MDPDGIGAEGLIKLVDFLSQLVNNLVLFTNFLTKGDIFCNEGGDGLLNGVDFRKLATKGIEFGM